MRLTITAQGTVIPLQLDISGYHLEVSDISAHSISVSDRDGRLAICCIESQPAPVELISEVDDVLQTEISDIGIDSTEDLQADDIEAVDQAIRQAVADLKAEVSEVIDSEQLFQHLVSLRKQMASELRLPPYIIFHDKTLRDMCRLLPTRLEELVSIQGIGQAKLEKYGARFIQAIQEYLFQIKEVA